MTEEKKLKIAEELTNISQLLSHKYITEKNTIKALNTIIYELKNT